MGVPVAAGSGSMLCAATAFAAGGASEEFSTDSAGEGMAESSAPDAGVGTGTAVDVVRTDPGATVTVGGVAFDRDAVVLAIDSEESLSEAAIARPIATPMTRTTARRPTAAAPIVMFRLEKPMPAFYSELSRAR